MGILDNVTEYVNFLTKNKLTCNQFLLLYLLSTEQMVRDSQGSLKYSSSGSIYKWQNEGSGWTINEVEDLESKGYLIPINKSNYSIDQLIITPKFSELFFINSDIAFEEVLDAYPDTITVQGSAFFTKTGDLDKLSSDYKKIIKNSQKKHEEVIELIKFARQKNLINCKLDKFLTKPMLDSIRRMKGEAVNGEDF
jgi:hypothetical protein